MGYSKDLRERVLAYNGAGHTIAEKSKVFKAETATISAWKKLLSETVGPEKKELERKPGKFESEKLRTCANENPEATLNQTAEEFGGSPSGAFDLWICYYLAAALLS